MSLLKSFGNALQGSITADGRRQARSMQEKNIQLAEEQAQRTRNLDSISELSGLANDLGISKRGGEELDISKLASLLQEQRDSGKFDPKLERFITGVGNKDLSVERNPGFSFTNLQKGPDGTLTMQGTYEGDGKTAYVTSNRQSGEAAPVGFGSVEEVAKLVDLQYNQEWNKPGNSAIKREMQLKGDLIVGEREALQGKIRDAVGSLTNELEEAILELGGEKGPEISTKLKRELAGKPYTEQLKVLQQYGSELQVPVSEIVTPEVEEAAAISAAQSAPADNSAEIAALEARIAKVPPGRGGVKRKAALQKQVDELKSAPPAPAEEAAPVDENPAIQSGVEKAKAATDEDIVEGKVQFTQEEVEALQERLKAKDITALEDMIKATPTEQQMLRAMLSTIARDADQRKEYLDRMNNVMSTGSTDFNSKQLQEAQLAQQTEERAGFQAETSRMTAETGRLNYFRQVEDHDWKVSEKVGDRIRGNFAAAKAAIYGTDDDGNINSDINFDEGRFFSEYKGAFEGAYAEFRNAPSGTPRKAETQVALNSMISMGIQALAESEEYGSFGENFLPDGGIDYIDGNDNLLSRLQVQADGSVIVYNPTTGSQQDESVPASVLRKIFGDSGYAYFIKEIRGAKGSLKARAKTNKAD